MKGSGSAARGSNAVESRSASADPFPLIAVRDVCEVVEQDWLVDRLLPRTGEGSAGYIFGPEKTRKSLCLADLALSVTTGTPALGRYEVKHTGASVGFFAEDAKGETSRRIHRLARARGVAVPANLWLINVPTLALDDERDQRRLLLTLRQVENLRFVWLDPMVRLHHVDDNRANELVPIHDFLRALSRSIPDAVLVLSHHTNKLGGSRGSTDFPAFGDFNLFLRRVDDHTSEVFRIDNRGGPPGQPFRYYVEDGESANGKTLRLVATDVPGVAPKPDRTVAIEEAIRLFRAAQPDASMRKCQQHLRELNLGVGSDRFKELWERAAP